MAKSPRSSQVKTRMPVLMAVVGAGAGFLIGYLLPMLVINLAGVSPDRADQASCCMIPVLMIAGGVGGFFYGRQMNQQQAPPKR